MNDMIHAFQTLWLVFIELMKIPDFKQSVYLSITTAIVGIVMARMNFSSKTIWNTCVIIELFVVISALFVV